MALPMPPACSPNKNLGKERFHKSHHFDIANEIAMMVGAEKPGIGGEPLRGQEILPKHSYYPMEETLNRPMWIAFYKQVLCFDAHFQEVSPQKTEETFRIRKCKIYFFLEDDTIQVVEPDVKNSGIPQGILIRRQRIPLPCPNNNRFYGVYHFNLNQQVVFFSRTFTITDCDNFTWCFLRRLGVRLKPNIPAPSDPYSDHRQEMQERMKPLRPYEKQDTRRQFMDYDRNVLRFYCLWSESEDKSVDPRRLTLHYFLADDTIEILEVLPSNSGQDPSPMFLRRSKLPKAVNPLHQPGEVTDRTVLNICGPRNQKGHLILDNLKTGAVHDEFYKDCDLTLGGVINVWGRKVLLCDCDHFTKEYYRNKYGIEEFTPVEFKPSPNPMVEKEVPPYTGFGSEEDSLCSCRGLLPKPPQKDFKKFMEKDRQGMAGHILRYSAKMMTDSPIDQERLFIICYYLSDDTMSVYERQQRNSGVIGGKFLERRRIKKPGQELYKSEMSEYYKAKDLYVGAVVDLNGHKFCLINADEYTFHYMEENAEEFSKANIGTVLSKVRTISEEKQKEFHRLFYLTDPGNTGAVPYEPLRDLLAEANDQLTEHEILTVLRHYHVQEHPKVDLTLLLDVAKEQLMKKQFDDYPELVRTFTHEDQHRTGRLPTEKARFLCKAAKLPLSDELLKGILKLYDAGAGDIDYNAFLAGINWKEYPPLPIHPDVIKKLQADLSREIYIPTLRNIQYSGLVEDVFVNRHR